MSNYTLEILPDTDAESPRSWDNLGTMVCWHRRYNLGDEQPKEDPGEFRKGLAFELDTTLEERLDRIESCHYDRLNVISYSDLPAYRREKKGILDGMEGACGEAVDEVLNRHYVILPLYLYDHSGITMNTTGFSCPWDSGQVGFIYVSLKKAAENWSCPEDWDHIVPGYDPPKTLRQATEDLLRGEVETYDQYLRGDVWGYVIEDEDGEQVDSCWGFFGEEYCRDCAQEELDCLLSRQPT